MCTIYLDNFNMPIVETLFSDSAALLQALRLSSIQWIHPPGSGWVFRGQADATWPLRPRLWRDEQDNSWLRERMRIQAKSVASLLPSNQSDQARKMREEHAITSIFLEDQGVAAFADLADRLGLPVEKRGRIGPNEIAEHWGTQWPASFYLHPTDLTALAQHHGIPTRLLDWTWNPLVAAYFAARDAFNRRKDGINGKHLAVWAINTEKIKPGSRIRVFRFPRYRNAYLHAQDGVFLFDTRAEYDYVEHGSFSCMGDIALTLDDDQSTTILKLTLPWSHCRFLLATLLLEQISDAHLMPSLDNIATTAMWKLNNNPVGMLLGMPDKDTTDKAT